MESAPKTIRDFVAKVFPAGQAEHGRIGGSKADAVCGQVHGKRFTPSERSKRRIHADGPGREKN
jgi:hypothetical protein